MVQERLDGFHHLTVLHASSKIKRRKAIEISGVGFGAAL